MRGTRRGGGELGADAGLVGDREGQALDALGLLQHVAKLLLEADAHEALAEGVERDLEVLLVEELGVVEAGANDALVAVDDRGARGGVGVGDHDEGARELAILVVGREVALVGEHRLANDLVRHGEELLVEVADEHCGPLAEVHDLVEDLLGGIDADTQLSLDLGNALADDLLAALGVEHVGGLEDLQIVGGLVDDVLAGTQHAMAAGGVAARDVSVGHRHDVGAEQAADPAHGAHEGGVLGAPALAAVVGPLEVADDRLAQAREQRHGVGRGDVLLGEDVLTAVGVDAAHERGGIDAALAGKALGGLGGVAVGVEGDVGGGAALDVVDLLGGGRDVAHEGGEAPRRADDLDGAVGEARVLEAGLDELAELRDGVVERR